MSIAVHLYSFTKRENSTKIPSSGASTYNCVLMDATSLMNPVFKLDIGSNPIGKNYAYVPDFNRYYFITDITSSQNFWYISCACDVLASFKSEIASQSHYILRSASDYDEYISDNFYPAKVKETGVHQIATNPIRWTLGHSYVIGVVGYAPSASKQIGSVTYYHIDGTALLAFITYLMSNITTWANISTAEYDAGVQKALINPMQYIVSAIALPVSAPTGDTSNIRFGYYNWNVSAGNVKALEINGAYQTESTDLAVTKHPQANTRGKYMNGAPFMSYILHFGPFGDIPLDPADLIDETYITCNLMYDLIKGTCRMVVYNKNATGNILYTGSAQVGVNINISQVVKDPLSYTSNAVNTSLNLLQNVMNTNPFGAASAAYSGIENGIRLKYPTVTGLSDGGSFLPFFDSYCLYLSAKYFNVVDENLAEIGRPLCQVKQISTLSGYILCQNADAQITGTAEESKKINDYMNSGFFYE